MDILHLTDLHVGKERGLSALLRGLTDALPLGQRFDFVVVSGDLTDAATASEYSALHDFLKMDLMALLRDQQVERVILCPGNHDVDWNTAFTEDVPAPDKGEFKEYELLPEKSDLRLVLDPLKSSSRVVRIVRPAYLQRFKNCSEAFSRFYGTRLKTGDHREFQLQSSIASGHWSAHVFASDRVAFYCFNSCFANDRHWRGAYIPQEAISEAKCHADQYAPGFVRVAVWHHGLMGRRGGSDFISISELGDLAGAGFDVGIHGHTHSDEQKDHFEDLGRIFPVIATGSFSAESSDRPDGVKNQAAVIDLNESYLRLTLFHRDAKTSRWTRDPIRQFPIRTHATCARRNVTPKVDEHRRSIAVDEDGIATVRVELKRLELSDDFVLACPASTARVDYTRHAKATLLPTHGSGATPPAELPIEVRASPSEQGPFYLIGSGQTLGELSWEYSTANAFALESEELRLGGYANRSDLKLLPSQDAVIHEVRAHTNQLSIELHLPHKVIRKACVRALRRESHGAEWTDDPNEAARVGLEPIVAPAQRVIARIHHPRVGYRYLLGYELDRKRPTSDGRVDLMLPELISACRDEPAGNPCSGALSVAIAAGIRGVHLLSDEDELGYWVLYLWHPRVQLLLPCAGNFPARSWGTSFSYGSGIAGHTFRHMWPSCYHADAMLGSNASTKAGLVFLPGTPDGALHDHRWLVSLPVMRTRDGDPVGVLGFADYSQKQKYKGRFVDWLATMAAKLCADPSRDHQSVIELAHAVSAAFWQAVSRAVALSADYRAVAAEVYDDHWSPPKDKPPTAT